MTIPSLTRWLKRLRFKGKTTAKLGKPLFQEERSTTSPSNLSESEWVTLEELAGGPAPIEELRQNISEVQSLIKKGAAHLSVRQYAWGMEFAVDLTVPGRQLLERRGIEVVADLYSP